MNREDLFRAIGEAEDRYILEADPAVPPARTKHSVMKWSALAACLVLLVYSGIRFLPMQRTTALESLPKLSVPHEESGMGFEALLAYEAAELISGNPWTTSQNLTTLPVFRNLAVLDPAGIPRNGHSAEEMTEKAEELAARVGLSIDAIEPLYAKDFLKEDEEVEKAYGSAAVSVTAQAGDIRIRVESDGRTNIQFLQGETLPESIDPGRSPTDAQARDVMEYLLEKYSRLLQMQSPSLDIQADYNIYGERHLDLRAYEGGNDLTESILGYNFDSVRFYLGDGKLLSLWRDQPDLMEKVGDYPIIGENEATEMLAEGLFFTSVPYAFPGEEFVVKTELLYRTGGFEEFYQPYYRFLVELPGQEWDNGLKTFGVYYVPAVERRFLLLPPHWEGQK